MANVKKNACAAGEMIFREGDETRNFFCDHLDRAIGSQVW